MVYATTRPVEIKHSPSQETLFEDMCHVVRAPERSVSQWVGTHSKQDRAEMTRIIGHLPLVRDKPKRKVRREGQMPEDRPGSTPLEIGTPRPSTREKALPPRPATVSEGVVRTPRGATPRAVKVSTPLVGGSQLGTPRARSRVTERVPTPAYKGTPRDTPRGTPPGSAAKAGKEEGLWEFLDKNHDGVISKEEFEQAVLATGVALNQHQASPVQSSEKNQTASELLEEAFIPVHKLKAQAAAGRAREKTAKEIAADSEATERAKTKLAECGIDPDGMKAEDILRIFYARGSGSSYFLMNKEASKRIQSQRATTPQSFKGVLTNQAEHEIRRARDLPATMVHDHLDMWEVGFLGEVCRSLRHFDEAQEGCCSEYMRAFTTRQYMAKRDRKPFARKQALVVP